MHESVTNVSFSSMSSSDFGPVAGERSVFSRTIFIPGSQFPIQLMEARKEFDRIFISSVLEQFNGNITHASRYIGMSRRNFQKRLRAINTDACSDPASDGESSIESSSESQE